MKRVGKILLRLDPSTFLYQTTVRKIRSRVRRWSRNRPEDEHRVKEIVESLETKPIIDGIVYAWDRTGEGDVLQVFDGWTRMCAAMRLKKDMRILLAVITTPR